MVLVVLVSAAGCGGGDDSVGDRERLVDMLTDADFGGLGEAQAECVADEMIRAGFTPEQLEEFKNTPEEPSQIDRITGAFASC